MYEDGSVKIPLYQQANESAPHEAAAGYFAGIMFTYQHANTLESTGQFAQNSDNFYCQPDFGLSASSRNGIIVTSNLVGEVMYSQPLADGHARALRYLSIPNLEGVILVDIQYPWPMPAKGALRSTAPGYLVYYLYVRGNVVPTRVVSFGTAPLTAADMNNITRITGCAAEIIQGYVHNVPNTECTEAHRAQYDQSISGRVILRANDNDDTALVKGVQIPLDDPVLNMNFNLFDLQRRIVSATNNLRS